MVNLAVIRLSQTNCYLLEAHDGYLLIDCGRSSDQQAFLTGLLERGVSLTDIHYLFLTHHHNDHCGLLPFLIAANPKIQVIMSRHCADYLQIGTHVKHANEHYANPALRLVIGTFFKLNRNVSDSFTPYLSRSEDTLINCDHDTLLPTLGINGKILLTPGHTEDSISIVTDNLAFVGDAARNILNFTGTPYQPILLYDLEACLRSWDRLIAAGVQMIFPAHGQPFDVKKLLA